MSDDLIKRSDAIKIMACEMYAEAQSQGYEVDSIEDFMPEAKTWMNDAPSVDTDLSGYSDKLWKNAYERGKADRPQGKWVDAEIPLESGGSMPIQACSLCKTFYPLAYTGGGHRFCPNCGAKMKGADDE